ncbi:MAG: hypothetical protein D4S01_02985 [Dehalococcoidia bacterium]|nr:MAG: hypothetical protein D4S01_02985 [Dehalococcoidia bacterium]
MSAKVIDSKVIGNAEELVRVTELAGSIRNRHQIIAIETEKIGAEKDEIGKISQDIFLADLEKDTPILHGNHEYHTSSQDLVTVNFRMQANTIGEIQGHPAQLVLKKVFGDDAYNKLFTESVINTLAATPSTLMAQAQDTPELFTIRLKDLDHDQLKTLITEHPDWLEVGVKNLVDYQKFYPSHVSSITNVKVTGKFIDKGAKIDGAILSKVKGFLKSLIKTSMSTAVICGNTSKTK